MTGTASLQISGSSVRRMLIPLALAQFICSFAGSNMNVMINDISHDLHTTVQGVQVCITLFLLVMAALMIPCGKLTDRWGRKRCFTIGLSIYGVGAVLSAVSPGLGVLILGNSILEGVGTALLIPPVYILTTLLFSDLKSRARAFGVISGMGGIGAATGPLIGGLSPRRSAGEPPSSSRPSSSWSLWSSPAASTIRCPRTRPVPSTPSERSCRPPAWSSWSGASWPPTTTLVLMAVLMVVGALILAGFFAWIRRRERAGKEPLLSTSLFRNRTSNLALVTQNVQWLMLLGTSFVVSAYLQVVRHYNAIQTGVIFTAATVGILLSSLAAGRLAKRFPQRTLILTGFVTTIVGIVVLLVVVKGHPGAWSFAPGLFLIGVGVGSHAHPVGQRRAIGLPRKPAGRNLRSVAKRVQPGVVVRHRDRGHHPGRRSGRPQAVLCRRHDRPGVPWPDRSGRNHLVASRRTHTSSRHPRASRRTPSVSEPQLGQPIKVPNGGCFSPVSHTRYADVDLFVSSKSDCVSRSLPCP